MSIDSYETGFLRELIAIPSVGGDPEDGAPYGQNSRKALQYFIDRASEEGFATGITDDKVGYVEFGSGDRLIGIVCHLDVVPQGTGWDTDPFTLTVKDGVMYGRGIVDDKGPACAAFFAMRRLKNSGFVPSSRVRLILGSDEERTCDCVETYASKCEIPDFAITPDAEFPVIFAEKGILHIKISGGGCSNITAKAGNAANMVPNEASLTCGDAHYDGHGKTSHASRPELGVNAILDLVDKLAGTDIIGRSSLLTYIYENISGKKASDYTGVGFTDISGGITANPAILDINDAGESLVIDIRYPVTASCDDIVKFMSDKASRYGLKVEVLTHMSPLHKEKDTDEIKLLTGIWSEFMSSYDGFKPEYASEFTSPLAIGGGTYARHLPNTVAFGLTPPWQEDQCHQANEHMSLNDFGTNVELLTETIKSLA